MHIYSDLIGFRPGSGVGSRLMKHPEKLRAGSPASISELPPIRKLPSLVSRPPSFAPQIRDVSLREETPRPYDDSMRTIDDETVSLGTTKEYDGRAVDPGKVYEPSQEKTNNMSFQPGPTQISMYSQRSRQEARIFGFKKKVCYTICVAKTKELTSCAVTAKLI